MTPDLWSTLVNRKRILVVDDQESMRDVLTDLLDLMGYDAHAVPGGDEALDSLGDWSVDLVISDLNMPGMDGLELMQRLHQEHPGLPVVIVTGYGTFTTERRILADGAAGYIPKPCTLTRVRDTVREALQV
ncbi:MAG: response regulator [Gemmatimonadota bacterium]|nr:response regulator [Gemmatimonadota bacterium]MDP7032312.1 response regulator [Gemmatimonadota bacterium]